MAARKTNAMYVMDLGVSMGKPITTGLIASRRVDLAVAAVIASSTQKLTSSKMFENGVCVYGRGITSNSLVKDGFYENVEELIPIGRTSLEEMKTIKSVEVGVSQGDMIDGLVVAYSCLKNFNVGKAQNRGMWTVNEGTILSLSIIIFINIQLSYYLPTVNQSCKESRTLKSCVGTCSKRAVLCRS